jgi:hypothetical protein
MRFAISPRRLTCHGPRWRTGTLSRTPRPCRRRRGGCRRNGLVLLQPNARACAHDSSAADGIGPGRRHFAFRCSTHSALGTMHRVRWLGRPRAHSCARAPRLLLLPTLQLPGSKQSRPLIQLLPLSFYACVSAFLLSRDFRRHCSGCCMRRPEILMQREPTIASIGL